MSAIALLMGLLVLSFLGSLIVGGKSARGLPSGVEYLGLGFAVGPYALGLVERDVITDFEPVVQVALGWLAFIVGLDFGRVEGRRVRAGSMVLGVGGAILTGVLVAFAVRRMLVAFPLPGIDGSTSLILAAGAGAVTAETTGHAVKWVGARWGARGPISKLLVEMAAADDLAPLVATGAIFAFAPASGLALKMNAISWFGASVALGAILGTVTALLLRGVEGDAVWGALIGTLLLGVGTASRFGASTIFVTFVMGVALAAASPSRRALRKMVGATERAVLYPMFLLAGARLDPRPILENRALLILLVSVILVRIGGKLVSGYLVRLVAPVARPAGGLLGIALLSSGPISISCGFAFALRFPGTVGDGLLAMAAASAVVGELVSTLAIKRLLDDVGEIPEPDAPRVTPSMMPENRESDIPQPEPSKSELA